MNDAMGNNMVIRRASNEDGGGYTSIPPSVTEDYAMSRRLAGIGGIALDAHPSLHNITLPVESLTAFFKQRRRWARGSLAAFPADFAFYEAVFVPHAFTDSIIVNYGSLYVSIFSTKTA